jgi:hypothetical protein
VEVKEQYQAKTLNGSAATWMIMMMMMMMMTTTTTSAWASTRENED